MPVYGNFDAVNCNLGAMMKMLFAGIIGKLLFLTQVSNLLFFFNWVFTSLIVAILAHIVANSTLRPILQNHINLF